MSATSVWITRYKELISLSFLCSRLAIDNWSMLSSYDGLYKNSFAIFRKSDAPYLFLESNPKIVSFSSGYLVDNAMLHA